MVTPRPQETEWEVAMMLAPHQSMPFFKPAQAAVLLSIFSLCLALTACSQTEDVNTLIHKLNHKDKDVRCHAAWALGKNKDPRGFKPLINAMEDKEATVRSSAKRALRKIGKPAVEPLIAALGNGDLEVRRGAVEVLGEIDDRRVVKHLIIALRDNEPGVRKEAAIALGMIKDPQAVGPLIATLKDQDGIVQSMAALALSRIGSPAAKPLIATLKEQDAFVQKLARDALIGIGSPAVEPLIAALGNKNASIQNSSAKALGEIKDPRAMQALQTAFQRENTEVIAAAYDFFIRRGEAGTETVLIKTLNKKGNKEMAVTYLNSGNGQLEEAAQRWARSHGYRVHRHPSGKDFPRWGRQ